MCIGVSLDVFCMYACKGWWRDQYSKPRPFCSKAKKRYVCGENAQSLLSHRIIMCVNMYMYGARLCDIYKHIEEKAYLFFSIPLEYNIEIILYICIYRKISICSVYCE